MQPRVAEFLHLPIVAIAPFSIVVGNGASIQCAGCCPDVQVQIADQTFSIPFYILPIRGAALVLGVQWLQTLGPFILDYTIPSIQFTYNSKTITLTGTNPHTPSATSYAQFNRFIFTDSIDSIHSITYTKIEPPESPVPNQLDLTYLLPYSPLPKAYHLPVPNLTTFTFYQMPHQSM